MSRMPNVNNMKNMKITLKRVGALPLVLVAAGLLACSQEAESPTQPLQTVAAKTVTLTASELPVHYMTSGTVTSDHRVSISSRLSGYVREMSVREGDRVTTGQVLVRVDPVDAKQALIQAKADLADAETDLRRYDELLKAGAVTSQQAEKVQLRYKVAKSQVEQARNQLSYAEVRSPVDGVVVEKRLSQGDLTAPGVPILTLEDPTSLLVETYVSEQYVSAVKEGATVDIHLPSLKRSYSGVVRQVVQAADPVSHQFLVKVALPAVDEVHPGMYAQPGFRVGSRSTLLIPSAAVISRSGLNGVYLLDADSVAHYRQVRLGEAVDAEQVELLAGLAVGDVIAWDAASPLRTGMKVQGTQVQTSGSGE